MSVDTDPIAGLALPDLRRVNEICKQFDRSLRQGVAVRLEAYLEETRGAVRNVLFRELVILECEDALRRGRGTEGLRLAERFPDRQESIREAIGQARLSLAVEAGAVKQSHESNVLPEGFPETFGRFRLVAVLGNGTFGTVFRAVDTTTGKEAAVKIPNLVTLVTPELRQLFLREGRAAKALDHPGIVRFLDAGEEGLVCYIASEYVAGTTLAAWLSLHYEKQERVPFETAARLIASIATAMEQAHDRGVYHNDLKPANVLLRNGRVSDPVVTDFGLARLVGEGTLLTATGQFLGTPAYMAPEQAFGRRQPGPGPDVYALGAMLYELLTGRPPFQAPTPLEIVIQKQNGEPISPRLLAPGLPRGLEAICLKCLEERPEQRYSSAGELAADLGRWLRGERVQARSVGLLGRGWRWCRRRPHIAALVAALTVASVGGITGILWQWQQAEAARRKAEAALQLGDSARQDAEYSESQAREFLNELLYPGAEIHIQVVDSRFVPDVEALKRAETYFQQQLQRRPDDAHLRESLSKVEVGLAKLYRLRGQMDRIDASLQIAVDQCESMLRHDSGNLLYVEWLALAYYRQGNAAWTAGHYRQSVRALLRAYSLFQGLADKQPGNVNYLMRLFCVRSVLLGMKGTEDWREEVVGALEKDAPSANHEIDDQVEAVTSKRRAFISLLLGEVRTESAAEAAIPCWREAYERYKVLARQHPDDLLLGLNLALCCSRLSTPQPENHYYTEAVSLLEQAAARVAARVGKIPGTEWPAPLQMDIYCALIACHWRAGRTERADDVFKGSVRPLAALLSDSGVQHSRIVEHASIFRSACEKLRLVKPFALELARLAATLTDRSVDDPSPDMTSNEPLAMELLWLSAILCQLDDPAAALRIAERARNLNSGQFRASSSAPYYGHALSYSLERIGKARWKLGQQKEALAAFRESAAVEHQVVKQAPSVHQYRVTLSRSYERLAYYSRLAGDRPGASAALLERQRLCLDDAKTLHDVAIDFVSLADDVAKGGENLSIEKRAEREQYLLDSQRAEMAARKGQTKESPR